MAHNDQNDPDYVCEYDGCGVAFNTETDAARHEAYCHSLISCPRCEYPHALAISCPRCKGNLENEINGFAIVDTWGGSDYP